MKTRISVTLVAVLGLMIGVLAPVAVPAAVAGPGSLISGTVWADTNRDGTRQPSEPARAGVTVQLVSSPGGAVVATTTTSAIGAYSFANAADGNYVVRVDAPLSFIFPDVATGSNDFVRAGPPAAGDPERGVTAPFTIAGATQMTGLDAGLQPRRDLVVAALGMDDACQGLAQTGSPPFDATEGPGLDTGTANCIVRTGDTVLQQVGVSLSGTGSAVQNVVLEVTVSSPDGAALALAGPGPGGIPPGCLTTENGANPTSGSVRNADGSITITCNLGTMAGSVAAMPIQYRVTTASAVPSHATITARAYAGQGDAGVSNTVSGPVVEVTGSAQWELSKGTYQGPRVASRVIDGVLTQGFHQWYIFSMNQPAGVTGNGQLDWAVSFRDQLTQFPNAIPVECPRVGPGRGFPASWGENFWALTCPLNEPQGTDGWQLQISPMNDGALNDAQGLMAMDVFIPEQDVYRVLDPNWQPGDDRPVGIVNWQNQAIDTDGWAMNGGQLNNGTGFEPGWDGTTASGDNVTNHAQAITEPEWDLAKAPATNPIFTTRVIDGEEVTGYEIWYNLNLTETNGALMADFVDDVTFNDVMTTPSNAILIQCRTTPNNPNGTTTCETGPQPPDGWEFNFEPNQRGVDVRQGLMQALFFVPAPDVDPCAVNPTDTIRFRNEARDTDGWTAGGELINGTGFEPGWDGDTATGNNVSDRTWTISSTVGDCGTYQGNKVWEFGPTVTWAGRAMGTHVASVGSNDRVSIPDLTVCDVFDVSVLYLQANTYGAGIHARVDVTGTINLADYVVEYAEGPNETRTQAPTDFSSIQNAARDCHTHGGPWATDPTSFGPDWQDTVNMIRVRPIDSDHVQTGPFALNLRSQLVTRGFYNGGPNAGQAIPSGVQVTNVGGWTTRGNPSALSTVTRQVPFQGMRLTVTKAALQTTYLPGNTAIWNMQLAIDQASVGATMRNVRIVDALPPGLNYDATCTQNRLPAGVTASYDPVTHTVTFSFGSVTAVTAPRHWIAGGGGQPFLQLCTTVPSLAQPGDFHRNNVQAFGDNSENAPTATAQIQITGAGQMGISKSVDKPYVASGEEYTWSLEWGNTSTQIAFLSPDVIDVLPWNGDGDPGVGSARDQYSSDFTGLTHLVGPLALPTYLRGAPAGSGGVVAGTWYYTTASPSTLSDDARDPANASPETPGGVWLTQEEIASSAGFDVVTAVRFVSTAALPVQSRVQALIPAVSTSNDLDNVYVNRATIWSQTVADQPLESNEPYVLMPGFTLGDLVWIDLDGNGRFDEGEQGAPGVTVQVRDGSGNTVATRVTDADGRWSVAAIPAGTYTVFIPPTMFSEGGPLADHVVRTVGASAANDPNEEVDNNNTATADPASTGLLSTPITLAYRYVDGQLVGANGPSDDNVAGLAGPLIPDAFTNFTVDLAIMPGPGIDIEKSTNGQDADTPTGPNVAVGEQVRWTYVVTNTGDVDLTSIEVTDDLVDPESIDCAGTGSNVIPGPLAPEASFTCVATGTATAGQYANTGTVAGLDPTLVEVTDEDDSHYFGIEPSVDIEKATNGQDADTPTGPLVTVDGAVRWTYVVTNTGNAALTDITVTDDMVDASQIDCAGTGSNVIPGPLAPDASFTCVANGVADVGQYANMGAVSGVGPETTDVDGNPLPGVTVADADPSHYLGVQPLVDIEKATNGQDADTPTGPVVAAGGEVRWTYVVTNTGTVPLTDVTVTDDQVAAAEIDCDGTGSNVVPGPLAPQASFTCVAEGDAVPGQYVNLGTVTGTGPVTTDVNGDPVPGQQVSDTDPSHYFGVEPVVDIEKHTNGQDADDPTGPFVPVDGAVRWTYIVTNTGNVPLTNVTVTDNIVAAAEIDCDGTGSNVIPGPLPPDASFTCVATGTATAGQYANLGSVTAVGPQTTDVNGDPVPGVTVDDDDLSHYFGATPAVDIEKHTNTQDADSPTGPSVNRDGAVRWTYIVTNTGNVPLTNVTVTDDIIAASAIDCDGTGSNVIPGPLAAGGTFTCVANGTAIVGQYANLGSVTGTGPQTTDVDGNPVAGVQVTDGDLSHYFGIRPAVDIEKLTNGEDADTPTGPIVPVGDAVEWRYVVTNTGDVPLTDVTVTDDRIPASEIDCAETGTNVIPGTLAVGDSYTCIATGTATAGQYANLGTVTGVGPTTTGVEGETVEGEQVTDEDWSHYLGAVPAVDIEKHTNGQDADTAPGVPLTVGAVVEWTYVVTNTGNLPLTNVVVTDDKVAASEIWCGDTESNVVAGPLAPGESFTCNAFGVAVAGPYVNMGAVTADVPALQTTVTDDDPSHYTASAPPVPTAPPATAGLPATGGSIPALPIVGGALLTLLGALLLATTRRRRT